MMRDKTTLIFILLAALIFSTMEVALKLAGSTLDAFQITFLRFLIGGLFLLPFAVHERRGMTAGGIAPIAPKIWLYMILLGAACVPFSMVFFQLGVVHSNASTAAVIFCCNPVFTMIFSHVLTKDDKMNARKGVCLLIGMIGIVLMIRPWQIQPGNTAEGAIFSVIAAFAFALYSVLGTKTLAKTGVFTQTSSAFIFGSLMLLPILLILGKPIVQGVSANLPLILYVSFVVTGAGYLLYFLIIRRSGAVSASVVFFLKPVLAPIIAVIILREQITWNILAGIAFILIASWRLLYHKPRN
ncbi:MAG: DMT family transporter [Clostridiales Family XIII bacterium]|jgi:drug/metabolite transporter (DMT)-like permease|nr:DMT family transporter [Clostridiales Family XIII bacterium]